MAAIGGAIGTVCEAIDHVVQGAGTSHSGATFPGPTRAFVAIRPPGHHCGQDTPAGFCFVNNIAIGAAHGAIQSK